MSSNDKVHSNSDIENIKLNFKELKAKPKLPNLSYITKDDQKRALFYLKDKKTIIHFWASWCGICVNELPELERYLEENNKHINFIMINVDFKESAFVKEFLNEKNFKYIESSTAQDKLILKTFRIKGLPTTLIVDKEGRATHIAQGKVNWNSKEHHLLFLEWIL